MVRYPPVWAAVVAEAGAWAMNLAFVLFGVGSLIHAVFGTARWLP